MHSTWMLSSSHQPLAAHGLASSSFFPIAPVPIAIKKRSVQGSSQSLQMNRINAHAQCYSAVYSSHVSSEVHHMVHHVGCLHVSTRPCYDGLEALPYGAPYGRLHVSSAGHACICCTWYLAFRHMHQRVPHSLSTSRFMIRWHWP